MPATLVQSESAAIASEGVLSGLLGAYQEQGYDWGYRRGIADVLASLLLLSEEYLRQNDPHDVRLRRLLYGFEAYVESHFTGSRDPGFVNGGLGI